MPMKIEPGSPAPGFYLRVRESPEKTPRQDSSIAMRWEMRAFWGLGEQVWGEEVNTNLWACGFWAAKHVMFRALPFPPWEPTYGYYTNVHPSRHAPFPWDGSDKNFQDHYRVVTPSGVPHWVTRPGSIIWCRADRQFMVKLPDGTHDGNSFEGTDGETAALINCPRHRIEMEIAFFTTVRTSDTEFGRFVADRPFRIPQDGFRSRVRGIPWRPRSSNSVYVYKNGVHIGYGQTLQYSTRFAPVNDADLNFEVGDVLTVRTPFQTLGARHIAFSLYCEAFQ